MARSEQAIEIGKRLKQARRETGMTQRDLAELLGLSERMVAAYEQGDATPYRFGKRLEEILGRQQAWFWHGDVAETIENEQYAEILKELRALRREVKGLKGELGRFQAPPLA